MTESYAELALELTDIHQLYGSGDAAVHALRGITLSVSAGDYVAIVGPSGSGKSTLMNLLGCLDVASSGRYSLAGTDVETLDEDQLAKVRGREIGFVFQSFNLIPRMTALANVELPLVYGRVGRAERRERALTALDRVGLTDRADHQPQELSGGQQQRVAVARAFAGKPRALLLDEVTSALDPELVGEVLEAVSDLKAEGMTMVIATHEMSFAREVADRVIFMDEGVIVEEGPAAETIGSPSSERARTFLSRVLDPAAARVGEVEDA